MQNIFVDVTIVIPTHNRHNYLKRILESYNDYDINIIIADSTQTRFDDVGISKSHINYIHTPDKEPFSKWTDCFSIVKTKYVVFCADDDFIFPNAIQEAVNFLNINDDFVCVQGELLFYKYLYYNKFIEYGIFDYSNYTLKNIENVSTDGNSISERIKNYANPYRHTIYGVHRTENIKSIYSFIQKYDIKEAYLFELSQAILTVISGKVIELKNLYHLREDIKSSSGRVYKNIRTLVLENHNEIDIVKKMIYDFLVKYKVDRLEASILAEKSIGNFLQFLDNIAQNRLILRLENNDIDHEKYHFLEKYYQKEPYLKQIEQIIQKYDINGGHLFSVDYEKIQKSLNKNFIEKRLAEIFKDIKEKNQKVAVYGAGSIAQIISSHFHEQISFFVDNDKKVQHNSLNGKVIYGVEKLIDFKNEYDIILISVIGREEEILYHLKEVLKIDNKIIKSMDF